MDCILTSVGSEVLYFRNTILQKYYTSEVLYSYTKDQSQFCAVITTFCILASSYINEQKLKAVKCVLDFIQRCHHLPKKFLDAALQNRAYCSYNFQLITLT